MSSTAIDPQDLAERQRGARALLLRPLLVAGGPDADDLRLVRRHATELTRAFAEGLGYRLQVGPGFARLYKGGLGRDGSRPLRRRTGATFTPRAYAMLCLALAALTRSKTQLLVDELVQQVRSAAVDAGLDVDLDAVSDRRALHAALTTLMALGVLRERDGDLDHWVEERTASLLDVRRDLLAVLVAAPLASATAPEDLLEQAVLPSAVGGARSAIRRRLLESPLLSTADLTEEQGEWWARNRNRERDWYRDRFGLVLELRAEGAAALDPEDELSDEEFPGRDKTRQLALLVLESLVDGCRESAERPGDAWRVLTVDDVDRRGLEVAGRWRDRLRRDQRDDLAAAVRQALGVLVRFGLVRVEGDEVLVHAAAHRYAPRVQLIEAAGSGERSLFDTGPDPDGSGE